MSMKVARSRSGRLTGVAMNGLHLAGAWPKVSIHQADQPAWRRAATISTSAQLSDPASPMMGVLPYVSCHVRFGPAARTYSTRAEAIPTSPELIRRRVVDIRNAPIATANRGACRTFARGLMRDSDASLQPGMRLLGRALSSKSAASCARGASRADLRQSAGGQTCSGLPVRRSRRDPERSCRPIRPPRPGCAQAADLSPGRFRQRP